MRRIVVGGLAVLFIASPVGACELERRALDMYASKLQGDRNAFELQALRTLAAYEARVKALEADLEKLKPKKSEDKKPEAQQP